MPSEKQAIDVALQKKAIEKKNRRKHYDDLQVQGTNNSSIVSKRSVEMLYTNKLDLDVGEWFKYFVPKCKRRSPAINRGYWIRMESIKQIIMKIIDKNPNEKVHIINLGCGFDPLPFQLLSKFKKRNKSICFIDIDYPELVKNKLSMIKDSPEILNLIDKESVDQDFKTTSILLSTDAYKLVGCDLKNKQLYAELLSTLVGNDDGIKIFVAEVSLAYMKPEFANPIIECSSKLSNSNFIILEQILPNGKYDAFAQKMLYHFNHLRSPLQCVETYPLKKDEIRRFRNFYPFVEAKNLFENWCLLIDDKMKEKVDGVEPFDEWEEFITFCQHYIIVHASNVDQLVYQCDENPLKAKDAESSYTIELEPVHDIRNLEIKFPGIASLQDDILIHGGLRSTRSHSTMILKNNELREIEQKGEIPAARMSHSLTVVGNQVYLTGGRSKPHNVFNDVYRFRNEEWENVGVLPKGRSRHATVALNDHEFLIFGGLEEDDINDLFLVYNVTKNSYKSLNVVGHIRNFKSCSMIYNGYYGLIIGGMFNKYIPKINDTVYRFKINGSDIYIEEITKDNNFMRLGCQAAFVEDNKILICGGVSPVHHIGASDLVITFDLRLQIFKTVPFPEHICINNPPILIGFGMVRSGSNQLKVLGGGAVCYSFGSCYNSVYSINY
ncbi:uncharacterized protein PRCAT00005567001 [Priceomyces carsonii]|uniref:uncharacterized protein n=1 Tax=Priceomyces carsonii TaxID=28549 RepID=UPI002EDB9534|nr:unnamed protein product [Priceomyces carsonii]